MLLLAWAVLFGASCTGDGSEEVAGPEATAGGATTPGSPEPSSDVPLATESPVFAEGDAVVRIAIPEPATLDPMRIGDPG
ncbi:MAG: hypothetical protein ABI571_04160, partial [Actinomycetota bacterium]